MNRLVRLPFRTEAGKLQSDAEPTATAAQRQQRRARIGGNSQQGRYLARLSHYTA